MKKMILIFFTIILFSSCGPNYADYHYEVTGTEATANITITDLFGSTMQYNGASIPWESDTYRNDSFNNTIFAYISAQNTMPSGALTVKIYRNGKVVKSATSSGAYCIASTSYSNQ